MADRPTLSFSHFGIFVTDLDKMVEFYTRFLGFMVSDRGAVPGVGEFAFLTRDPREHHQIVMATGRPQGSYDTVQQISFRVDSLKTLRTMYAALKNEPGISMDGPALGPISHTVALSLYFADPEGHRVELFIDTPWYITQPTRVPLDLSLSDAELMASIEAYARTQRGYRPFASWQADAAKQLGSD